MPPSDGSYTISLIERSSTGRTAIEAAVRDRAQALFVMGDPMFHLTFGRVPDLALRAKLPSMYLNRDVGDSWRRAALLWL